MGLWSNVLGSLRELVFPGGCPGCDAVLGLEDGPWCADCAQALMATIGDQYCPRCGLEIGPYLRDPAGCARCREEPSPIDGFARVGTYTGLLGQVIRKYKFERQQRLDVVLGSLLANCITRQPWAEELDGLVPVPATWSSRLHYRCAPVKLLAAAAGRELGLPVLPLLYARGKKERQVQLPLSERPHNVRGVFRLCPSARPDGRTLGIVDDVSTTGATLREVGRVLKKAGAACVYAAVVAKANPQPR